MKGCSGRSYKKSRKEGRKEGRKEKRKEGGLIDWKKEGRKMKDEGIWNR
jgi:hypothetical protein